MAEYSSGANNEYFHVHTLSVKIETTLLQGKREEDTYNLTVCHNMFWYHVSSFKSSSYIPHTHVHTDHMT